MGWGDKFVRVVGSVTLIAVNAFTKGFIGHKGFVSLRDQKRQAPPGFRNYFCFPAEHLKLERFSQVWV